MWHVFVGARCHAGVFYNPIDLKWPGREDFGGFLAQRLYEGGTMCGPPRLARSKSSTAGYVTHGSYDGIDYDKLKDARVCNLADM